MKLLRECKGAADVRITRDDAEHLYDLIDLYASDTFEVDRERKKNWMTIFEAIRDNDYRRLYDACY